MPVLVLRRTVYIALVFLIVLLPAYGKCSDISSTKIVINLPSRTLDLYSGSDLVKHYPVAIGKPSTPTPIGSFYIINKEVDPVWMPPNKGYVVPSGPDNPLGYRWMGFLPLYGIHGTNAPWAVGLAVSNGCVRMHEEDVEELYEIVAYGTPVIVTYERVKVLLENNGQVTIGIYPDIYGYKEVHVSDVYSKLAEYGLSGFVSESIITKLIEQEADKQVYVTRIMKLKVNGRYLNSFAVESDNLLYVPVWAIAASLNQDIIWDEAKQIVRLKNRAVPGVVKGDTIYVSSDSLQLLFGGQQFINTDENCLEVNSINVMVNGKLITEDVQLLDGVLAVPVLQLSDALGQNVSWNENKGLLKLKDRSLPYGLIDNRPYLKITQINEYFNAVVFFNQQNHTIEINYPFIR